MILKETKVRLENAATVPEVHGKRGEADNSTYYHQEWDAQKGHDA